FHAPDRPHPQSSGTAPRAGPGRQATGGLMTRTQWELADVVRQYGAEYLKRYTTSVAQRRVMRALQNCRTAVLGGHVETCRSCDHRQISYNSCRNRHCPKCQGSACAQWMQRRAAELLPVPYFHVVFTLPNV